MNEAGRATWEPAERRAWGFRLLIWAAGLALCAGVAISAFNRVGDHVARLSEPGSQEALSAATTIGLYVLFAVLWVVGMGWLARRITIGWMLGIGLLATVVVRAALSVVVDAALVSDWLAYHTIAQEIVAGGPRFGDLPIGYPMMLALVYWPFGPQVWAAEALNVGIAAATAALVFDLLRRSAGATAASVGIAIYAVMPSLVLMSPVVGTEPTYTLALLLPIWLLAVLPGRLREPIGPIRAAVVGAAAAGAALGLSQYVRATSVILLPAFVIAAMVLIPSPHAPKRAAGALALAFFVVLAPVIVDNAIRYDQLSVATSSYGGYSILVGTNQTSSGFYNLDDVRLLHSQPGDSLREQSDAAGRVGLRRIASDPLGFASLAYRKFVTMWGEDGYGVFFGLEWERDPPLAPGLLLAGYVISAVAWAFVTIAALLGILRSGPQMPGWLFIGLLVAGSLAALHLVVEIQPRYHAYVVPIWIGAAALGLARIKPQATEGRDARP